MVHIKLVRLKAANSGVSAFEQNETYFPLHTPRTVVLFNHKTALWSGWLIIENVIPPGLEMSDFILIY